MDHPLRAEAENIVAVEGPAVGWHCRGTVERGPAAVEDKGHQSARAAVPAADQGKAFTVRLAGLGQDDAVAAVCQSQGLGDGPYGTGRVALVLGVQAAVLVVAADVVDENVAGCGLARRRHANIATQHTLRTRLFLSTAPIPGSIISCGRGVLSCSPPKVSRQPASQAL